MSKPFKNKINTVFVFITVAVVLVMGYVEKEIAPPYLIKSLVKVILFTSEIAAYSFITKKPLKSILSMNKLKSAKALYIFMAIAFVGIIALFMILKNFIDTNSIRTSLMSKEQLTKGNCIFVFSYIAVCNSFLEEAFFRGFVFNLFENKIKTGYIFSGLSFAYYHIGMVSAWFNPFLFVLCIAGLAIVGMVLQFISRHYNSLKASWLIHGCANLAINTIGIILIFGL